MVQPDQQPDQELLGSQVPSVKSAAYKSNLDPMAVLKRVEELRRWQEEEKMKLLQAHEDQMNQFRMEQERLTKQVTGASQYPTPQQTTFQQSNLTKQNCRYLYDDAYSSESDSNLQLPNNKELQTSTDSGYTNSEGHFTTNNSSELTIPIPTMQNKKQTNPQYYHSSADDEDTSDSSLNEQDLKLVKLITNQIRMKKINLEAFIDDDFDNDDALNVEKALASYDDYSEPLKDAKSSSDKIERVDDEDLDDNQQLSTILEVSCESESPLKKTQKRAGTGSLRTKVDDIHEEDPEQEIENVIECNEKDEIKSKNSNVLDVDSIPIGVKPTNKMSFEELLEESLKKQDQLDMEQQKNGNRKKPVVKKPFLMKNSGTNKVQAQAKVQQSVAPVSAPVSVPAPVPVQVKISKDVPSEFPEFEFNAAPKHSGAPRPFLKRGEGLKRFQSKQNESAVSNKSESNKPSVKSNNGAQQLRSNSTTSLNNQLAQQQQMTQQRIMRKSQSITNVNQNTTSATKKTLPQKFNLQSKSSTTLNNENQNSLRSKSKILESSAISTLENSTAKANQKLKPAVQVNSTPAPEQVTENPRVKSVVSNSDDELKEFEKLEQYVDEHPSFRSSVSFVENVLSSNPDQNSKANNKNSSKATKFAYMLNLLNSNNSKKLADLLEEELNELSNTDMSDDRALSNSFSYDKPENLNENIESEALNEYKEHEFNSSRQRSSSSCSNSSIDSLTNRRRSHSASSGQSSSRVVMRKIKRIQIGDQVQQNSTEQKVKYASITASETALNLKKKYSCINYEDAADFYTSKENDKDEFCEDQFEAETSYDRQKNDVEL